MTKERKLFLSTHTEFHTYHEDGKLIKDFLDQMDC